MIRFGNRSLTLSSNEPGVTTKYTVSFKYTTPAVVGSVDMLFCIDPIPYHPCDPPAGLNVANAVLSSQTGETGFSISTRTSNHLVLTRSPAMTGPGQSTYEFTGIVNPTYQGHSFVIRMTSHASTDASGPFINGGGVLTQARSAIELAAQVPPMLVYCMGQRVELNCTEAEGFYSDMGTLAPNQTLTAESQIAVGTNASSGFAITVNGLPMSAGTNEITPLSRPTPSAPGNNQFGINLMDNSSPDVGEIPDGEWFNGVPTADYGQTNRFTYRDGDLIATSPDVSLMRRFTISYIVNTSPNLPAGVYTTTLTYVASGRF